nr:hypothetical protein [Tanacetum cinerariifolium]
MVGIEGFGDGADDLHSQIVPDHLIHQLVEVYPSCEELLENHQLLLQLELKQLWVCKDRSECISLRLHRLVLGIVHRCLQHDDILNDVHENKAHFLAEKEAIHLILTGIGDEIYSTVDACQTAQERWEAIERNNLTVTTMQVNVQFLQQLQPEWSRFVTIVKKQHKLDRVSYHKLFDILKQYQNKVNELRAERLARNANLLALVATAQANQDPYYQTSRSTNLPTTNSEHPHTLGKQYDWLADMDEEVDEQELEAHYSYMAKIHEVPTANSGTDSEPVEHVQNDARHNVFTNGLQHSEQSKSVSNTCLVETDDSNVILDSPDMCEDDIRNDQNDVESDDERVALANLIANLKFDVDENKKIQKKLKKANTTLAQELKEYKAILAKTRQLAQKDNVIKEGLKTKSYELSVVKEKHDKLIKQSLLTKSHYEGPVKKKKKVITDLKLREEHDIEKMLSLEKQLMFLNEVVYKRSQSIQSSNMMAPKVSTYNGRPTFSNPRYLKQAQSKVSCLYAFPYDQSTHANRLIPDREETLALERESRSKLNKGLVRPYDYTTLDSLYEIFIPPTQEYEIKLAHGKYVDTKSDKPSIVPQPNAQRIPKPSVLGKSTPFSNSLERIYFPKSRSVSKANVLEGFTKPVTAQTLPQTTRKAVSDTNVLKPGMYRINNRTSHTRAPQLPHNTNVSRPQLKSNQSRDKVLPNNSQVKVKKTQVEVHPRIPSVSNKMKSVTACKDNLNSRTLNANVVCATCNKCLVDFNYFSCVMKMLNDMNARTKKPNVVPISTRKPKSETNKSIATPNKKKVASKSTN